MDEFSHDPDDVLPTPPIKGRGATANIDHRFTTTQRAPVDDGWTQDLPPAPQTRLEIDSAKSILSYNESPDLPFDRAVNPYRGCEHGCIYCYARPTHAWLGLSPGLDFETRIFHKPDAVDRLREAFSKPDYQPATLALGTATDAYQPFERQQSLTRRILEFLLQTRHPVSIVTKGALITRDLDVLGELVRLNLLQVSLSLTTLNPTLARQLEPRASSPAARLRAMSALADAGIPVAVFTAPLIPGLTDHELEKMLTAARDHGARQADYSLLRLPHEVAGLFREWLSHHAPEKSARIMSVLYDLRGGKANDSQFGRRMHGLGHFADLIRQRFSLACQRLGLSTELPVLDHRQFTPPKPDKPGLTSPQLSLF